MFGMFGFGKRRLNNSLPNVDPGLFQNLRQAIRDAILEKLGSNEIPSPQSGLDSARGPE